MLFGDAGALPLSAAPPPPPPLVSVTGSSSSASRLDDCIFLLLLTMARFCMLPVTADAATDPVAMTTPRALNLGDA